MKPKVFVSSTCYDLSQIRQEISTYLNNIGFIPILSEHKSFPINPENDTYTNCIETVRENADLFILLIGNRYGSKNESGKSITNLEYLTAKEKNVPIYIFINKKILPTYEVWKRNKSGNFEGIVDDIEIFKFIEKLRDSGENWCFEFEYAGDIIECLKEQFSFLFKKMLDKRKIEMNIKDRKLFDKISPEARRILILKNELFEFEFFNQVLFDEYNKIELLKDYFDYNILTKSNLHISEPQIFADWSRSHFRTMENISTSFTNLFNNKLNQSIGAPGEPADLNGLFLVAVAMTRLLEEMIKCSLEIKSVSVNDEMVKIIKILGGMFDDSINTLWRFPQKFHEDVNRLYDKIEKGEEDIKLDITVVLNIEENTIEEFNKELENLTDYYL